ncbi:MAG: FecR domain-containing protein, partial [Actinomycetota bacterium]|nr:FecR domain-containing protein [Actinomycetota bacterium]
MSGSKRGEKNKVVSEDFDSGHPLSAPLRYLGKIPYELNRKKREILVRHLISFQERVEADSARKASRLKILRTAYLIASISLLALVTVAVLFVVFSGREPSKRTVGLGAKLENHNGDVQVLSPGRKWRDAEEGEVINEGDSIRTKDNAFCSILLPSESIIRMGGNSGVLLKSLGKESTRVEHLEGETYHRVCAGTNYLVELGDVSIKARGTAFAVQEGVPKRIEVVAVESGLSVSFSEHSPIKLEEGEVLMVDMAEKRAARRVAVAREKLEDGLLRDSVCMDRRAGFRTG